MCGKYFTKQSLKLIYPFITKSEVVIVRPATILSESGTLLKDTISAYVLSVTAMGCPPDERQGGDRGGMESFEPLSQRWPQRPRTISEGLGCPASFLGPVLFHWFRRGLTVLWWTC